MPKINVYLPDDLADAVRETGVPVSAICQRALEEAVKRITAIRQSTALDVLSDTEDPAGRLGPFTARSVEAIRLGVERARAAATGTVSTGDLLVGMLAEGDNMALRVLSSLEIEPASLIVPAADAITEPSGGDGLRFSTPAAAALERAVAESTVMGHNDVGCEHLLIGLVAEPDGVGGRVLRAAGADLKSVRRTVVAALAGFTAGVSHPSAQATPALQAGALTAAVRRELQPLVERLERLEARSLAS